MSLKEQLAITADKVIEDAALIVALCVEDQLLKAALNGEKTYDLDVTNENFRVMSSETFLSLLSMLLDDVKVEFIQKAVFSLFYMKYLRFSW